MPDRLAGNLTSPRRFLAFSSATSAGSTGFLRPKPQIGTFADAAAFGEIVLDCTNGANSLAALRQAGDANLRGKIIIQVRNPLDTSKGMPPTLTVYNTDSPGEQTQREFPDVRVVKAFITVNCEIIIAPSRVPGDHELFICGNDAAAKREVTKCISEWVGWKPGSVIDLGDITNSRGTEMFLAPKGSCINKFRR